VGDTFCGECLLFRNVRLYITGIIFRKDQGFADEVMRTEAGFEKRGCLLVCRVVHGNQKNPVSVWSPDTGLIPTNLISIYIHGWSMRVKQKPGSLRADLFSWPACPIPGALKLPRGPRTIKPLLHKNMVFRQKVRQRLDERCLARSDSQTARNGASRPLYSRYLDKNKFALLGL
jgi:hypothetical protein